MVEPEKFQTKLIKEVVGHAADKDGNAIIVLRAADGTEYGICLDPALLTRAILVLSGSYTDLVQPGPEYRSGKTPPVFQGFGLWRTMLQENADQGPFLTLVLDGLLELALSADRAAAMELATAAQQLAMRLLDTDKPQKPS